MRYQANPVDRRQSPRSVLILDGRRRFILLTVVLLLVAGSAACDSASLRLPTSYHGTINLFGREGPSVDILVSADESSLLSFSVSYLSGFAWGAENPSTDSAATVEFLNVEEFEFRPGDVPIEDGAFSYSRRTSLNDQRSVVAFEGCLTSGANATGTLTVARVEEGAVHSYGEFLWNAAAE